MLQLPHLAASSRAYSGVLQKDFELLLKDRMGSSSRKKLRQKERMLAAAGPVSYQRAQTTAEISRVLETFFGQKRDRMRELGLSNVFDAPGVREFVSAAANRIDPETGEPVIQLYAAYAGETIVATFGGIAAHGRFSGMFNSMAGESFREHSPGELLLSNVVRLCCERGFETFDLGIGDASYKQVFCNDAEVLYNSVIPVTPAGYIAAPLWRAALAMKAKAKRSDAMMRTIRSLQQLISTEISR
jgi:CelD/BcsL family acetyltransferase involved in cellulose biosynthesis